MNEFEKEQIENAFNRCFGLQEAFKKAYEDNDSILKLGVLHSLSQQSGLRKFFIENNLTEILGN